MKSPKSGNRPEPAKIRIDGGKRRDLDKQRVAARMSGLAAHAPTAADAAERRKRAARRARAEREAAKSGCDGTTLSQISLRISGKRAALQSVRCRPGSFEWRHGRDQQSSLFHAGSQFAQLWERSGIAVASSANFLRGTASGYSAGLSEGRAAAMQELRGIVERLGHHPTERLIAYCVRGETAAEMARRYGVAERDMGSVLMLDLKACAEIMKFGA